MMLAKQAEVSGMLMNGNSVSRRKGGKGLRVLPRTKEKVIERKQRTRTKLSGFSCSRVYVYTGDHWRR